MNSKEWHDKGFIQGLKYAKSLLISCNKEEAIKQLEKDLECS
jgi:hypothetical protein